MKQFQAQVQFLCSFLSRTIIQYSTLGVSIQIEYRDMTVSISVVITVRDVVTENE